MNSKHTPHIVERPNPSRGLADGQPLKSNVGRPNNIVNKHQQTKEDLRRHLVDCAAFLRASSGSFDSGTVGEAKRLATTIRVLLHDTKQSKSLLLQLGTKHAMRYLDTALPHNPHNLLAPHGLVGLRMETGAGARFWAPLDNLSPMRPNRMIAFADWWNAIVIVDSRKARFSRRELVLALANQDGGAHVDPNLDRDYALLTRTNTIGWQASKGEDTWPIADVELHSVRQVAYELLVSLERHAFKATAGA